MNIGLSLPNIKLFYGPNSTPTLIVFVVAKEPRALFSNHKFLNAHQSLRYGFIDPNSTEWILSSRCEPPLSMQVKYP